MSLHNARELVDIKNNPIVDSVLLAPIKAIPVIGDFIDSSAQEMLNDFQQKKEQELLDVILKDSNIITLGMVNDVEFIVNYNRTLEAVRRLLLKPTEIEQKDIFELLHRRRKKSSTIFCSQYGFEEWYDQLGGDDSPLADAIIDQIAHDSYRINITSIDAEHDISMREVYGLDKMLRE